MDYLVNNIIAMLPLFVAVSVFLNWVFKSDIEKEIESQFYKGMRRVGREIFGAFVFIIISLCYPFYFYASDWLTSGVFIVLTIAYLFLNVRIIVTSNKMTSSKNKWLEEFYRISYLEANKTIKYGTLGTITVALGWYVSFNYLYSKIVMTANECNHTVKAKGILQIFRDAYIESPETVTRDEVMKLVVVMVFVSLIIYCFGRILIAPSFNLASVSKRKYICRINKVDIDKLDALKLINKSKEDTVFQIVNSNEYVILANKDIKSVTLTLESDNINKNTAKK